jgi:hypothetical protein
MGAGLWVMCDLSEPPLLLHPPPQKYRLYLKRLAGLPANAPLSADTLQQVRLRGAAPGASPALSCCARAPASPC